VIRTATLRRVSPLLIAIAIAAGPAKIAGAQVTCAAGYVYNQAYGCLVAGEAYPPPALIYLPGEYPRNGYAPPPVHVWHNPVTPIMPSNGFHAGGSLGGGFGHGAR